MNPPKTHTDAVRRVAKEYGYNKRHQFYISKCQELFGIDVGSSTISRAIGIFSERMHRQMHGQSDAEIASKELLNAADGDIRIARRILDQVFMTAEK